MFAVSVAMYLAFAGSVMYFCVFADPRKSPTALYATVTLPAKARAVVERCVGKRNLRTLEVLSDKALMLFYCVIVFGSWTIIFCYVYPWVDRQSYVPHYHKWIGYVVFGACVYSWRLACTTSPGIITSETLPKYDHYPYDSYLFVQGQMCRTRRIPKLARSKFDRFKYKNNVPRFDHFCGWVYNTIGEENYRWFLLFLLVHVGMCLYGSAMVGLLFYGEIVSHNLHKATYVDRFTGEEIPASKWIIGTLVISLEFCNAFVIRVMHLRSRFLLPFL